MRLDRTAPVRFLRMAYAEDDWIAIFLKSYVTGRTLQRVGPVGRIVSPRFQACLRALNTHDDRWNVYVGLNAITPGMRARTKAAIRAVRHVFLDVDQDGAAFLTRLARRSDLPPPSYIVHSSPNRVHVLWRVRDVSKEEVERLQRYLARDLGTDPAATSCSQTTRVPGFLNHKRDRPFRVSVQYRAARDRYSRADFPMPPPPPPPAPPVRRLSWTVYASVVERARHYLAAIEPAVTGQHGDQRTFRVACRLVRGFALDDAVALQLLEEWNARCQPPWTLRELAQKVQHARRYGREPIGGLLGSPAPGPTHACSDMAPSGRAPRGGHECTAARRHPVAAPLTCQYGL